MNVRFALVPLLAGACLLTISGCRTEGSALAPVALVALRAAPSPPPIARAELAVSCTPHGVSVTGTSVAAGQAGVPLRVSSSAVKGTYLNYTWTGGGGGGNAVPRSATTWTLIAPPGQLRLSCSTAGKDSAERVVTVVDPGHYWRAKTLGDLGCAGSAVLDWAAGPGRGATAEAAVNDQVEQMRKAYSGWLKEPATIRRADFGYSVAGSETWLLLAAGRPHLSVSVTKEKHGFTAYPNALC